MGNKTRIAAAAVSAVMALSVVPQAAFATNGDLESVTSYTKMTSRLGGLDRAQTAAKIADAHVDRSGTVILTVGRNYPDALAATPLADQLDAPILLNDGARLNQPTAKWLFDNVTETREIIIVGGSGVIPQTVIDDILGVYQQARGKIRNLEDPEITRYSGVDRFETAYEVSARTTAGYFAAGQCTSTGVNVYYTPEQRATATALTNADARLDYVQGKVDAYNAAKAEYERTKAAFDAADLAVEAAQAAYDAAVAELKALTEQMQVTGDIAELQAEVARQGQVIAAEAEELAETRALAADLRNILFTAVQSGIVETEEDVWEALYAVQWTHVRAQLPELSDAIDRVLEKWGGVNVGQTRARADLEVTRDEAALEDLQEAYADAVNELSIALEKQAANSALAAQINAASAKVVAAKDALDAAIVARDEAFAAYSDAAAAYAALVDGDVIRGDVAGPALTPGELAKAQRAVDAALDAVVAKADNVPVFATTGRDFADALTAGPAAADQCGVILLTEGNSWADPTTEWITTAKPLVVNAVGGPARNALGQSATAHYVGRDRFETAKLINLQFLSDRNVLGIATGYDFPDALTGAALVANADGGLLLVRSTDVPQATVEGVHGGKWTKPVIFGGTGVVSGAISAEINGMIN